jgi:pimeloyl-ACP methyl ester carboxylesterase
MTYRLSIAALILCVPGFGAAARVNGIEMYYEMHGDGAPLVLLHGFGGSGQAWSQFVPEFSKHYKVILPDLRGHGRSTNPSGEFTHRQSGRDVFALLDTLGIQNFAAMGISTGGMTLLHMATSQPQRVQSMVLIGATTYFPEQARAIMRKRAPESLTAEEIERAKKTHVHGEAQFRSLRRQFYNFKDSYDDMTFRAPQLATIQARTFVVHGDRDEFFPVSIPVEMYTSIPKSYLWIVPNGGHVPLRQHAAEFTRLALEFLSGKMGAK